MLLHTLLNHYLIWHFSSFLELIVRQNTRVCSNIKGLCFGRPSIETSLKLQAYGKNWRELGILRLCSLSAVQPQFNPLPFLLHLLPQRLFPCKRSLQIHGRKWARPRRQRWKSRRPMKHQSQNQTPKLSYDLEQFWNKEIR